MATSPKLVIGAIVTFLGVAGLVYSLPQLSNAAANKQIAFTEAQVKGMPANMKMFIPVVIGSAITLMVGMALVSLGVSETLVAPQFTPARSKPSSVSDRSRAADTA